MRVAAIRERVTRAPSDEPLAGAARASRLRPRLSQPHPTARHHRLLPPAARGGVHGEGVPDRADVVAEPRAAGGAARQRHRLADEAAAGGLPVGAVRQPSHGRTFGRRRSPCGQTTVLRAIFRTSLARAHKKSSQKGAESGRLSTIRWTSGWLTTHRASAPRPGGYLARHAGAPLGATYECARTRARRAASRTRSGRSASRLRSWPTPRTPSRAPSS